MHHYQSLKYTHIWTFPPAIPHVRSLPPQCVVHVARLHTHGQLFFLKLPTRGHCATVSRVWPEGRGDQLALALLPLAVWPWESYFPSLGLSFLTCEVGE